MMFGEQQLLFDASIRTELLQFTCEKALLEQLLLDPERQRHGEAAVAARREREVGLEQPLELDERLVVEGDEIEIVEREASRREAELDCVARKPRIVLAPREALFL